MKLYSSSQDFSSAISVQASDFQYALGLACVSLRLFPVETWDCNRLLNFAPNFHACDNENDFKIVNRRDKRLPMIKIACGLAASDFKYLGGGLSPATSVTGLHPRAAVRWVVSALP